MIDSSLETALQQSAHDLPVLPESLKKDILQTAQQKTDVQQRQRRVLATASAFTVMCLFVLGLRLAPGPQSPPTPVENSNPYSSIMGMSSPNLEWAHVESTTRLKQKNLQALRNAF